MKTRLITMAVVLAVIFLSKRSFSSLNPDINARSVAIDAIAKPGSKVNYRSKYIFTATAYPTAGNYSPGTTIATSNNGLYNLVYQNDGNLVLCNNSGTAYWASGPQVEHPIYAQFGTDGNIGLFHNVRPGFPNRYWYSNVTGLSTSFFWCLQDDGNFVRYGGHSGAIDWSVTPVSTGTGGPVISSHFNTIQ